MATMARVPRRMTAETVYIRGLSPIREVRVVVIAEEGGLCLENRTGGKEGSKGTLQGGAGVHDTM